jgi:superfamily II DNA or RNA helicase
VNIKSLRPFQEAAIDSGVALFSAAKRLLDVADRNHDAAGRHAAIHHNGYLLIEAPTGSGKTLMAGCIVEKFTATENIVWFWFAPFKGVVGQTADFLREQFQGLRLRDLDSDRSIEASRAGDAFVTTWQSVATRVKDKRNVRKEGELNPSIDTLVQTLREQGLRIGVVVDEAHHGFGGNTQAAIFFRETLRPEYTILITATPDDADVKAFEKAMGIAELQRIRVSRADAVDAGLIKSGVKCAAYCVIDPAKAALVDLQTTALRDGVAAHKKLKAELARRNIPLVPLLLVQADSKEKSVEKIRERLLKHGFSEEQIATHTAAEPDDGLLAIANDDRREVLIFKMAVALGFDAPRAFTLVSMRAARDPDFGVQLIGRLLRVHRLLQDRAQSGKLPAELNHGYVFLADLEAQDGLDKAGQRINQIQTEYAKVSASTVVLHIDRDNDIVGAMDKDGQPDFFLTGESSSAPDAAPATPAAPPLLTSADEFDFGTFFTPPQDADKPHVAAPLNAPALHTGTSQSYRYPLRADVPRCFKTQTVGGNNEASEEDCAQRFIISTRDLFEAMKSRIPVERRTLEVFTQAIQREFNFAADFSAERAARLAHEVLCRNQAFDPRELRNALLKKLAAQMREEAMEEADHPEKVRAFLNTILATDPKKLYDAEKAAIARNAEILDAEPLPETLDSAAPLAASARNIYGIYPEGLNSWEKPFAELLDRDPNNIVLWWHRNEPRKPWSVNALMPDGRGFYPDFIIGIHNRPNAHHALLVDPKLNFAREDEAPKTLAIHQTYGRVMILSYANDARWKVVTWNEARNCPVAEREFRLVDAAGW